VEFCGRGESGTSMWPKLASHRRSQAAPPPAGQTATGTGMDGVEVLCASGGDFDSGVSTTARTKKSGEALSPSQSDLGASTVAKRPRQRPVRVKVKSLIATLMPLINLTPPNATFALARSTHSSASPLTRHATGPLSSRS
jgi:hypothetical protein